MKSLLNQVKDYILPQYPTFSSLFVIYGNDTQDDLVSFINRSMKSLKKKIRQSPLSPLTLSKFQISAMKEVEDLENIESDDEISMQKKSIVNELKDQNDLFSFNINVTPIKTESKEKIEYDENVPEEFPFPPATPSSSSVNTPSSSTNVSPFDLLFPLPPTSTPSIDPSPPQQVSFDDSSNKVIDYSPIKIRSKSIDDEKLTVENSKDSIPSLNMREISNDDDDDEEKDMNNDDEDNDDDEDEIDEIPLLTVEEIFQHEFFQNIIRVYININIIILI